VTTGPPYTLSARQARRLALVRAGLLQPKLTGLPARGPRFETAARQACLAIIRRFGYLQLDTVAVAGARSHALVLMSRLPGIDPLLCEGLLKPAQPLFEYWGHEASWLPMELYPYFEFRRQEFRHHPWWGDVLGENPKATRRLLDRIRQEGPLRSLDLEGQSGSGWDVKLTKKVASALWSRGDLAIRERRNFQRVFDLAERVIPSAVREAPQDLATSLRTLLLLALSGHGWAQTGTLAATWRLRNLKEPIAQALQLLVEMKEVVACDLTDKQGGRHRGWIRTEDLELADKLARLRPRRDRGTLLSPFDPVLWDRTRTQRLFEFHQVLEIFKPVASRLYGYFCLPVLVGDHLVARVDLKADRKSRTVSVLALHHESDAPSAQVEHAVDSALSDYRKNLFGRSET
jgi:uncharacterized protein YcaQ